MPGQVVGGFAHPFVADVVAAVGYTVQNTVLVATQGKNNAKNKKPCYCLNSGVSMRHKALLLVV